MFGLFGCINFQTYILDQPLSFQLSIPSPVCVVRLNCVHVPFYNIHITYIIRCLLLFSQTLPGPPNSSVVVENTLTPFTARYVRLYPKSWIDEPAINMELYGCVEGTTSD